MISQEHAIREKWNLRHADAEGPGQVAAVLANNLYLLPTEGRALDLACGRGANALLLARSGLAVAAWDISDVAINALQATAEVQHLAIDAQVRDVLARPPEPESFDVILVSHFLERNLADSLVDALRPGGLLFYQTFAHSCLTGEGPKNPAFRLGRNELLALFSSLKLVYYRENEALGNIALGLRDLALFIGQKPATGKQAADVL